MNILLQLLGKESKKKCAQTFFKKHIPFLHNLFGSFSRSGAILWYTHPNLWQSFTSGFYEIFSYHLQNMLMWYFLAQDKN